MSCNLLPPLFLISIFLWAAPALFFNGILIFAIKSDHVTLSAKAPTHNSFSITGIGGVFMSRLIYDTVTGRLKETEVARAIDLREIVVRNKV